jgi:hypothetical protein
MISNAVIQFEGAGLFYVHEPHVYNPAPFRMVKPEVP